MSQAAIYEVLASEVESVYSKGFSIGLSEYEIDSCLKMIMTHNSHCQSKEEESKQNDQLNQKMKHSISSIFRYVFRMLGCIFMFSIVFFGILYIISSYSVKVDRFIANISQSVSYPLMRFARVICLPLNRKFDLTVVHDADCLLPNHFYKEESPGCSYCNNIARPKSGNKKSLLKFHNNYIGSFHPVIFKDAYQQSSTNSKIQNLLQTIQHNPKAFVLNHCTLYSCLKPTQLLDCLSEDEFQLNTSPDFAAVWTSRNGFGTWSLKQSFPKPYFLPESVETSSRSTVYLAGPRNPVIRIRESDFEDMVYIQGFGTRTLVIFSKFDECLLECKPIQITMRPGSAVYFNHHVWRIETLAPQDHKTWKESPSLAYVFSFR